jgi:hypothetical protein
MPFDDAHGFHDSQQMHSTSLERLLYDFPRWLWFKFCDNFLIWVLAVIGIVLSAAYLFGKTT